MVNNSSLPSNIRKAKKYFTTGGIQPKLSTGPTSPIAGPTFPNEVALAPKAVLNSIPNPHKVTVPNTKMRRYTIAYILHF